LFLHQIFILSVEKLLKNEFNNMSIIPKTVDQYWTEQVSIYEKISAMKMQSYLAKDCGPELRKAFFGNDLVVRCIDEGVQFGIRTAGSGILSGCEEMVKMLQGKEVKGVESHEECGAAKLYAKMHDLDEAGIEEYASAFSRELAKTLVVPYMGHSPISKMKRPKGHHISRCIYVDGSGIFDPKGIKAFPLGFVTSRAFLDFETSRRDVDIALQIASGGHGFGDRITTDNPFYVFVIGSSKDERFSLKTLISEMKTFESLYQGRVKIDGFTAPA
jgi:hypothetical protein